MCVSWAAKPVICAGGPHFRIIIIAKKFEGGAPRQTGREAGRQGFRKFVRTRKVDLVVREERGITLRQPMRCRQFQERFREMLKFRLTEVLCIWQRQTELRE